MWKVSEGLHSKASGCRDCPRPESGVSLMSSLYMKCCQNIYLVSEPVSCGILNTSSYVLQSPLSPVFLIPKQDQRQLGKMTTRCEIVWQECQHGFFQWQQAKKKCRHKWGNDIKYERIEAELQEGSWYKWTLNLGEGLSGEILCGLIKSAQVEEIKPELKDVFSGSRGVLFWVLNMGCGRALPRASMLYIKNLWAESEHKPKTLVEL